MEKIPESVILDEEIFGNVRMWVEWEGIRVELRDGRDRTTYTLPWESLEKRRQIAEEASNPVGKESSTHRDK